MQLVAFLQHRYHGVGFGIGFHHADGLVLVRQMQEKEMAPLLKKLEGAVEQVANEEKLDLVFMKTGVFVRNKSLDITEKVRSRFK